MGQSMGIGLGQIRTHLRRGTRSRWVLARALVCLSAPLVFLALQQPWVVFTLTIDNGNGSGSAITESLSGNLLPNVLALRLTMGGTAAFASVLYWAGLVWYGVPLVALLLALALWQRTSVRLALATKWIFRVWLVVMTLLETLVAWLGFDSVSQARNSKDIQVVSTAVGAGIWLALVALALLWVGAYLMLGEPRIPERAGGLAALRGWRRTRAQLVALGMLLAGLLLWGLGYIALPWATANCAPRLSLTHYVDGFCAGLDSGDTLMAFVGPHLSSSASFIASNALYLAYMLLFGSALLLVAGAARSAYGRSFCGWVLAWLVVATGMALLSYRGVPSVVASPPFTVGSWHGDVGIVVTFAGLLCVWASLIPLEAAGLARETAVAATMHKDPGTAPGAQAHA